MDRLRKADRFGTYLHRMTESSQTWLIALAVLAAAMTASAPERAVASDHRKRIETTGSIAPPKSPPRRTVVARIAEFGEAAEVRLSPRFTAAGVPYPPRAVALVAIKDERVLELHARGPKGGWRIVHRYPVLAASGTLGPKLREGDLQVPEGVYRVTFLNPNSLFHVSLRLDYPNAFDRAMGTRDGRVELGGDIMIHGSAVSTGCLAMGDDVAEELFTLAARIGMARMEVVIAPTDLRLKHHEAPADPPWLAELYAGLGERLRALPFIVMMP